MFFESDPNRSLSLRSDLLSRRAINLAASLPPNPPAANLAFDSGHASSAVLPDLTDEAVRALTTYRSETLQYAPRPGLPELRARIVEMAAADGIVAARSDFPIARIVNRIPAPPRVLIIDSATRGGYSDHADFYIDRPVEFVNQTRLAEAWEQGPVLAVLTPDALRALPRQPAVTILATERHGLTVVTNAPTGRGARHPGR